MIKLIHDRGICYSDEHCILKGERCLSCFYGMSLKITALDIGGLLSENR